MSCCVLCVISLFVLVIYLLIFSFYFFPSLFISDLTSNCLDQFYYIVLIHIIRSTIKEKYAMAMKKMCQCLCPVLGLFLEMQHKEYIHMFLVSIEMDLTKYICVCTTTLVTNDNDYNMLTAVSASWQTAGDDGPVLLPWW